MGGRLRQLTDRIGRRGAFLAFLAVLDVVIGYSLLTAPPAEKASLRVTLPLPVWAWIWVAVGALCAAGAFMRRDRIPYGAAAALKAAWAIVTARSWLAYHTPQGWAGVIIWVAFAIIVLLISSWPEPPPAPRVPPPPRVPP